MLAVENNIETRDNDLANENGQNRVDLGQEDEPEQQEGTASLPKGVSNPIGSEEQAAAGSQESRDT